MNMYSWSYRHRRVVCLVVLLLQVPVALGAVLLGGRHWAEGTFHISTGDLSATGVGNDDWEAAFRTAVDRWNQTVPFTVTTDAQTQQESCGPNEPNTAFFSDMSCSNAWGANVLGVSNTWSTSHSSAAFQTSIVFNSNETWAVYDGPLNGATQDFTRVAVHEIGHSMGLGHTANATAIMTPAVSSTINPQIDDTAAIQALYGTAGIAHVLDSNNSGANELAVVRARMSDSRARVQSREVNTGGISNTRYYATGFAPMELLAINDNNTDGDQELAVVHKRLTDDRATVEVREAEDGALLNSFVFSSGATPLFAMKLTSNNNASTDIAAVTIRTSDQRIWVQVRDSASGSIVSNVYFPRNYWPRGAAAVPDINGNGADEIALLLVHRGTGRLQLQVRDSVTGALISNGFHPTNYSGHGLVGLNDVNGDGSADLASLVERDDGRFAVRIQDGATGATLKLMFLLSNTHLLVPLAIASVTDVSGNTVDEVVVLLMRNADDRPLLQIRDASTGNLVRNIYLGSKYVPQSMTSIPTTNGGQAQEIVVTGFNINGTAQARLFDTGTGTKIRTMTFAIP